VGHENHLPEFGVTEEWVKQNLLHKNGNVNRNKVQAWLHEQKLVWHHHQDMRRLQLVKNPPHDDRILRHMGGDGYIRGVTEKLMERPEFSGMGKRDGITEELLQKAREYGYIPEDFPW
jgi:hypothetical protein